MEKHRLLTHTLRMAPWGASVATILAAACAAAEPAAAMRRHMWRDGSLLTIDSGEPGSAAGSGGPDDPAGGVRTYNLQHYERVLLVGAGKAGAAMAHAAADILGPYLSKGIVIVKDDQTMEEPDEPPPGPIPAPLTLLAARHPLPDERGVAATRRIAGLLEKATARDLVIALISGGGSALLTLPAPGISLEDLQQLTRALLACGASIDEINTLRKQLDLVKGGGLARLAAPAHLAAFILSDVVGNPLDTIASGPTVPGNTTFADAWEVLQRYNLLNNAPLSALPSVPHSITRHIEAGLRGEVPETPRSDDPLFARVQNTLVGSNQQAAAAALQAAQEAGFNTLLLTTYAQGEARVVGWLLGAIARELATTGCGGEGGVPRLPRPACLVLGGETTVTLRGSGQGGRNQELALAAVRELAGLPAVALVTLATDGGDGPTDAAGAVVTGDTLARALALGRDPDAALANNDAYPFFAALGDLLRPGPTGTNVNDLAFVFAFEPPGPVR